MGKVLFITNLSRGVGSFSIASVQAASRLGMQFYMAGNFSAIDKEKLMADEEKYGVRFKHIDLARSPYSPKNLTAYKQLVSFIREEKIDYIHCNTPIGGILGRLAGKKCKVKKIIYQVHGFHFYDGAPKKNWMLYYPVEKYLAHLTDAIITINKEDYVRAQSFHLRQNGKVYYVPGVGIDLTQYNLPENVRANKRMELGLADDEIALISMGDLIDRKNYPVAMEAISKCSNPKLKYFICGQGPDESKLKELANSLGIEKQVQFLGFRTDIKELLKASDIFLFTSKQEGLARSLMEAMASGLPCIASRIRGNTDLLEDNRGGYLCSVIDEYVDAILDLINGETREKNGRVNLEKILDFNMDTVEREIKTVYTNEFSWGGVTEPLSNKKRNEVGIPNDVFVLISVGELNKNKNNQVVIKALSLLKELNIHYLICGRGDEEDNLKQLASSMGLSKNVHFAGYRTDIKELLCMSDAFVMTSYREGLSRSIMEAMACGLPCLVSDIRGNIDLITNGKGGFLNAPEDIEGLANCLRKIVLHKELRAAMGAYNLIRVKEFELNTVTQLIANIYKEVFEDEKRSSVN